MLNQARRQQKHTLGIPPKSPEPRPAERKRVEYGHRLARIQLSHPAGLKLKAEELLKRCKNHAPRVEETGAKVCSELAGHSQSRLESGDENAAKRDESATRVGPSLGYGPGPIHWADSK